MEVTLVEITADNLRAVMDLKVKPSQEDFVAPNSVSIAQHCFNDESWMRAICAGDDPVGFVLLSTRASVPRYYLWRYMIDGAHQGKGYGAAGMDLLVEHVRTLPRATALFLSYVPAPGGPRDFYAKYGFADTGREQDGEREMRLEI
ncbi:MAG: GNAT family N-acetyltransferase [Acidimicrobiia bacterium]|nr:GNAT family N-acetyltransferase [Acidimicrobiia bacterium]